MGNKQELPADVKDQFAVVELHDDRTYVIREGMQFPAGEQQTGHISMSSSSRFDV